MAFRCSGVRVNSAFNRLRDDVKLVMINGTLYFLGIQYITAMAYGAVLRRSGGDRNPKCGNLRDSGMSGGFTGYSSQKRDGW